MGSSVDEREFRDQRKCATTIQLSLLSYIFIALFRDTPLATIGRTWPDGQMAKNGHGTYMALHIYAAAVQHKYAYMKWE